jgi:hypothetical protein
MYLVAGEGDNTRPRRQGNSGFLYCFTFCAATELGYFKDKKTLSKNNLLLPIISINYQILLKTDS